MQYFQLKEIHPFQPPNFEAKTFQVEGEEVILVSFNGEYPNGSKGNVHGKFIAEQAIQAVYNYYPYCLILDFRKMTYSWGNTLLTVFQDIHQLRDAGNSPNELDFPILVLGSDLCRTGILSLSGAKQVPDWYFEELNECILQAIKKGEEWINN